MRFLVILVLVFFIYRLVFQAYDFGYRVFSEPPISEEPGIDIDVTIPMGSGAMDIGEILENRGLIRDKRLFFVQERLSAYHGKLEPGTYTLNTSMTAEDMIAVMSAAEEEGEEEDGSSSAEKSSDDKSDAGKSDADKSDAAEEETADTATDEAEGN
ncbi:MAG: endolytic transglycosylase MltG [Lachnospiraceae bacterium]|nr:endolytic transglycosylase MltG [Lachnospiraceae bacterium]